MSKIFIRFSENNKLNSALNYEFKRDNIIHISICPIPQFIGEVKCDCGELASIILNDEIYKCNKCTSLLLPKSKLVENTDISSPLTIQSIKKIQFEFSFDGER
jgi:hypothetical protein